MRSTVLAMCAVLMVSGAPAVRNAAMSGRNLDRPTHAAVVSPPGAPVQYAPPVSPVRVLRGFEPPASPYGPGHYGVDLALTQGNAVLAAADGVVTFAGPVAGRGVVVIMHADGIQTEYEPVTPTVAAGAVVTRGLRLGALAGWHSACAPASCLHWGARRGEQYLDPLTLLEPLGPVRLLPWPR